MKIRFEKKLTLILILIGIILLTGAIVYVLVERSNQTTIEYRTSPGALIIETNKDVYSPSEPITVTVKTVAFRNEVLIDLTRPGPTSRYDIILIDAQGQLVPLTLKGRHEAVNVNYFLITLNFEEIEQESFELGPLFEISKSGEYTLIMQRNMAIEDINNNLITWFNVVSNPVTFTRLP